MNQVKFVAIQAKSYIYLVHYSDENKNAKGTVKLCHKRKI